MWWRLQRCSGPPVTIWGYSSSSELIRWPEWWEEHTTLGQGSFRERSSVGSRFSESLFLHVPVTANGTIPNLWFQKKFVKYWQSTQNTRLRPTDFFRELYSYSPFDVFWNLGDVLLRQFWVKRVLWPTVPGFFRCFFWNCRYFPLIPQRCHDFYWGKVLSAVKTKLKFYF